MGLLGLVKVAKGLVPSFLHVGAILTVIGGLFACCYNCRWYNAIGDARRGYKTVVNSAASSAMASGIFGVFAAIAAIAAVALSFTGLSNTIVTIVYAVTLVLYLGEMIPEAVLIGKTVGMFHDVRLARDRNWIYTDEDFWYFSQLAAADQNKLMPVDPNSPEYWEQEHANPERDWQLWDMANNIMSGNVIEGFASAVSVALGPGDGGEFSFSSPCVFNFKKSNFDYTDTENCDKIDIKVERCVSTWSAGAVTRALKKKCNDQKEQEEKEEESIEWAKDWQKRGEAVENAYMEELEKNYNDIEKTFHDGESTMETYELISGFDSVQAVIDLYDEYQKKEAEIMGYNDEIQEYVRQGGIAIRDEGMGYIGMHTANQAIIAIQTVGFFFTLVGVVLSFVLSMLPVDGDDAAKPEA